MICGLQTTMGLMREWRSLGGGYHGIRELMRELISANLDASYCVLWSDGDSKLDRLFVPYGQSNIIQLVKFQPPSPYPIQSRTISRTSLQ